MITYKYTLEKYSGRTSRHICPQCKQRTLTRYIDIQTKEYISSNVGRCSREEKCAYHYSPKMYFEDNEVTTYTDRPRVFITPTPPYKKPSTIPQSYLSASLQQYANNNFAKGLYQYFNHKTVNSTLLKYYVGTAKGEKTIFWQVNRKGEIRTGKIILYNQTTLKRSGVINWAHTKFPDFNLKQLYFGAHLLKDTTTPIAIAEGEKNAILGALYFPQYNWLAVGGLTMLNIEKLNALKNYDVSLFPDKGKAFIKWTEIAHKANFKVKVNDILEKTALPEGSDIADLIIEIKTQEKKECPNEQLKQMELKNPLLTDLIKTFDLSITT